MAAALAGVWNVATSDNFEEYMKASGVGFMTRKLAGTVKPVLTITVNGDDITINSKSTFKDHTVSFKLGETFDEETIDGRKYKSIFNWTDGKLVQTQTGENASVITRYLKDDHLVIDMDCNGVKATRTYTKA
uniref:Lipocln_cytosolic_FA-bd_dom domain-containing protein n=1 Tax=Rhabditophanes sp. KR3021 TaxID=114890 RepID=A0AC35U221_9BILA